MKFIEECVMYSKKGILGKNLNKLLKMGASLRTSVEKKSQKKGNTDSSVKKKNSGRSGQFRSCW